ncbi:ABC transporter substrate-binding protein [Rhodococcus artemisiae]|uniref:ABC transporter substrate-binding protein n=1 Tax=Rhodococcus artemisiae TaxID=714159 RepID=A0ABU7L866_9NOCA|nr:ABC transporter substrate-binding protein [Rhodococcus artemisiae]MEE2057733.1 ABC transporter substrate-binding protein [Rhodococcus artemisiae]
MRVRFLAVCAATALVGIGVAGCSTADDADTASAGATDTNSAAGAASVEHVFGTTTVEGAPERIVATSSQWVDALLELGVQPVGYISAGAMGDDRGLYPWQSDVSGDAVDLAAGNPAAVDGPLPVEPIAALEPDLILGNWQVATPEAYDTLDAVAPTLAPLSELGVDNWDAQLRALGTLLDRSDEAEQVIADTDAQMDEAALPGLEGKTGVLAQYMFATDQFVVVADPDDGAAALFSRLGMTLPQSLVDEAGVSQGRLMLSPERVDALVADLLIILPNGGTEADLMALPGFDQLPAVTGGGLAVVDYPTVVAFNTPSASSTLYALGAIGPQLDAVAGS